MDIGPPSQRRATRRNRVSSPSAAKSGAEPASSDLVRMLAALRKIFLDQRDDHGPAALISSECLGAPLQRNLIESGFSHRQLDIVANLLQLEHDERRWLV